MKPKIEREPSASATPSHPQQPIIREFTLDLFAERSLISNEELQSILDHAKAKHGLQKIFINQQKQIPELEGTPFSIEDFGENKMQAKCDATLTILQDIEHRTKNKQNLEIIILIPEGIVSFIIGQKGGQINKIMKETDTDININQPINRFPPRTVKIKGNAVQIYNAIKIITKKMQEKGVTEEDYDKIPEPVNPARHRTKVKQARFVYPSHICDYIMKIKNELEPASVVVKQKNADTQIKGLKREEKLIQLDGHLKDIQLIIKSIINRADRHFQKQFELRIVMPSSYASKLIGQKGCLIRELAQRSKGAQIKVLSDKEESNPERDCLVQVAGSVQSRQEACVQILEKIECFRSGGPILESGKHINDTFQQQYKNSVQQNEIEKERSDKQRKYKGGDDDRISQTSYSSQHSRSRESSRDKHNHRRSSQRRKYRKQSRSVSSSHHRGMKQKKYNIKILVPKKLMDEIYDKKKMKEWQNDYKLSVEVLDKVQVLKNHQRQSTESILQLDGYMNEVIKVLKYIMNEQYKMNTK